MQYSIIISGDNNVHQWYKDGILLTTQISNTLYIENASYDDQGTYVLKVTNTSVPDLELVSYDAELSIITRMDEVVVEDFAMYPNPASGNTINISVDDHQAIEGLMIINGSGQVVKTERLSDRNNSVDISKLVNGMYIVKIIYKNGSYQIEKLIVK